jgi:hypothetical protein
VCSVKAPKSLFIKPNQASETLRKVEVVSSGYFLQIRNKICQSAMRINEHIRGTCG